MSYIKVIIAGLLSIVSYLIGDFDTPLIVLVCFILLDFISGLMVGLTNKNINSEICFRGLMKKSAIILVLIMGTLLDRLLGNEGYICRTVVSWFYIANEGISLLENSAKLGLPIPQKIIDVLEQLKDYKKE